ncbi:MAG: class I SAM-dependent methyltransferase [bacterium]|nr:MAG: class I SAM-dependent methyltransferase [bacterium]
MKGLRSTRSGAVERIRVVYRSMFRFMGTTPSRLVYERHVPAILNKLQAEEKPALVLDAGCGVGNYASWFTQCNYIGIDAVNKGIEAPSRDNISFCMGLIGTLPFADESFDFVFCSLVLQHVNDVEQTLSSLYRVLKPGGTLLVTTTSKWARLIGEMPHLFWRIDDPTIGQAYHYFDAEDIARYHRDAGFRDVRVNRIDGVCIFCLDLLGTFFGLMKRKLTGRTYTHKRTSTDTSCTHHPPKRNPAYDIWKVAATPLLAGLKWLLVQCAQLLDYILPPGPSRIIAVVAKK